MSDVAVVKNNGLMDSDILNPQISIEDRLNLAGDVAAKFKQAIQQLGLIQKIKGKDYVTVSGWSTLGTMIGIHVENIQVEPFPTIKSNGFAYKAKVDLVDKNGFKIGEGEGICSNSGFQKEEHAVYSMAITRATGKAYRLSLAWLVEMAGYNSTPYEEMPEEMIHTNAHIVQDEVPVKKQVSKNDDFVTAKEVGEPNPEDDPIRNSCQEIKDMLEEEGKTVTKMSMRIKVVQLIKQEIVPEENKLALFSYIDKHCPEELE